MTSFRLKAPEPLERDMHEAVARALDALLLPPSFWCAYPAGHVELAPAQAARLVRCGLKSGMPDILIFYKGVYLVELKRRGGRVSKTRIVKTKRGALREIVGQEDRFRQLLATGAVVDGAICYSVNGVLDAVRRWEIPMRQLAGLGIPGPGAADLGHATPCNGAAGRVRQEGSSTI